MAGPVVGPIIGPSTIRVGVMRTSDQELVVEALAGSSSAVAEIYDRYADRVYSFCISRLRNAEQAADATQDTFVKAAERLDTLRRPDRLRSWLFAIARNQIIDQVRQRDRFASSEEAAEMVSDAPDHDADLLRAESAGLLWEAAGALQERDADLLELQLRQGLEGEDLADAIGVTTSHLHVLQSRLRDRVERALGSLLIARQGQDDCTDLRSLLADWDGTFTLAVRSKVTRHVERCDICQRTRSTVLVPANFLGVLPLMAIPLGMRARVVAAMENAIRPGAPPPPVADPWLWRADGFPEAPAGHAARGRALWLLAGAAVIIAVVIGALLATRDDNGSPTVTAAAPTSVPTPPAEIQAADATAATPEPDPTAQSSSTPQTTTTPAPSPTPPDVTPVPDPPSTSPPANNAAPAPAPQVAAPPPAPTPTPTPVPPPPTPVPPPPVPTPTPVPPPPTPTPTPIPGSIVLSTASLDLGLADTAVVQLSNPGQTPVDWTASTASPFSAGPTGGQLAAGATADLVVSVDRSGLVAGTWTGQLIISGAGTSANVSLSARVNDSPVINRAVATPSVVQQRTGRCPGQPVTIIVNVSDTDGVASVIARWPNGTGTTDTPLGLVNGEFTGAVGPFVTIGSATTTIIATDTLGASTSTTVTVTVTACPPS